MKMNVLMNIEAFFGAILIKLLGRTWRIRFGEEEIGEVRRKYPAVIYAFWHGRLLPLSFTHRNRSIQVLASRHRDGELLGRTIRFLGFGHVRGSSTRGGARAVLELVEKVKAGHDLGITVDGPKGPRFVVKPGSLEIAKLTGMPIIPITTSSRSHWQFTSWDRFQLPKPFTRVYVKHGDPIMVAADAGLEELEAKRRMLQDALLKITRDSDAEAT
jgi:lysophospholipid acyltransferase (LPLAT)-like uncharacterized protein